MARVGLLYDPAILEHQTPANHPERSDRARSVYALLESTGLLNRLEQLPITPATRKQLERVHDARYLDAVERIISRGGGLLDSGDTVASAGSWRAIAAAAGSAIGGVDAVMEGVFDSAFALVRPPGHHAMPDHAMGFCIVNHAAVAAAHAVAAHDLSRVLIVDFDVHHGNGTQEAFYDDPRVLYFSTHQSPAYPGTGHIEEIGEGDGAGYTVNVPLPADVGDDGFRDVFSAILRPIADRFQPELVIVSAGYDAHWRNSAYVNGIHERMTVQGVADISRMVKEISDAHCPGRLVGILEGGYDLESLAYGARATLTQWLGDVDVDDPIGALPENRASPDLSALLARVKAVHHL